MEINRNNYEEYFLLYVDGELAANECAGVEKFVEQNPDLKQELEALLQVRLNITDDISFNNKAILYKNGNDIITQDNYEEYLLNYIDNELTGEEKKLVEVFTQNNPAKIAELIKLQSVKLDANETISFENRAILYRTEKEKARIIPLYWKRIAAAASVIIIATFTWWLNSENTQEIPKTLATTQTIKSHNSEQEKVAPQTSIPAIENNVVDNAEGSNGKDIVKHEQSEKSIDKAVISSNQEKPASSIAQTNTETPKITVTDNQSVAHENTIPLNPKSNSIATPVSSPASAVKPVIIDQADFKGENKDVAIQTQNKTEENLNSLDTEDTKKPKGKFRGLFRKASRFIDRVTNADTNEDQSVVRVASFEIAKK